MYTNNKLTDKLYLDKTELIGVDLLTIIDDQYKMNLIHELGQLYHADEVYSKSFKIKILDKSKKTVYVEILIGVKSIFDKRLVMIYVSNPNDNS